MTTLLATPRCHSMMAIAATLVGLASAPAATAAQSPAMDARWQPWIGCWQPADVAGAPGTEKAPLMCVVPSDSGSGVDVVGLVDGKVTSRERVQADGLRRLVTKEGCTGLEQAEFSSDSRRVYLHSKYTCKGDLERTTSGMLALTSSGEWLDIQSVKAGGSSGVRAIHYRDAGAPKSLPADIAQAISGQNMAVSTARTAAAGNLALRDVIDASKHADSTVVQAWLVERGGLPFSVDANDLVQLADAGVPGSVTDVLVATSYPRKFAVERGADMNELLTSRDSARVAAQYLWGRGVPVDPFGLTYWDMYSLRYGSMYGYPYGYGYSRYGYGGYYGPGYGYYLGGGPIVVVRGSEEQHGKVDKERGYTRGGSSSGGSAQPTTSRTSGGSTSSGSGSSGGRTSTGRTAKPRP